VVFLQEFENKCLCLDHVQAAACGGVQVCQRAIGQGSEERGQGGHLHAHDHGAGRCHARLR
jgi:hypothetical protein